MRSDFVVNEGYSNGQRVESALNSAAIVDSDGSESHDIASKFSGSPKRGRGANLPEDVTCLSTIDEGNREGRSGGESRADLEDELTIGTILAIEDETTCEADRRGEGVSAWAQHFTAEIFAS